MTVLPLPPLTVLPLPPKVAGLGLHFIVPPGLPPALETLGAWLTHEAGVLNADFAHAQELLAGIENEFSTEDSGDGLHTRLPPTGDDAIGVHAHFGSIHHA